ncbi:hypothetical protein Goklo_012756, partial [Gossypium klotzschianum]|nr:hypothetical protein [Gossypium klotzschianum]
FYTLKSAYSWLSLKRIGFGPHRLFWRIIWKLKMLPKIKIFSWRIDHDILPTYHKIARIHLNFSTTCSRCKNNVETLLHAMKECPKIFFASSSKAVADFFTLLWNCWTNRNKMVFQGKADAAMVVWERAQTLSDDFRIFNMTEPPAIPPKPVCKGWKKPPNGFVKINVDAAVANGCAGYGDIARDHEGFVVGGCYGYFNKSIEATWAEMEALAEGLKLASRLNVKKLMLESDNAKVVNTVKMRAQDVTILGCYAKTVCMDFTNFDSVHINWIDRCSNKTADLLCNLAIKKKCNLYFNIDYPLEVHNFVINDAIK